MVTLTRGTCFCSVDMSLEAFCLPDGPQAHEPASRHDPVTTQSGDDLKLLMNDLCSHSWVFRAYSRFKNSQVGRILAGELKGLTEAWPSHRHLQIWCDKKLKAAKRADDTWSGAAKRKLVIQAGPRLAKLWLRAPV